MRNSGIFLGFSVLLLAFGCKKSPELATENIPAFKGIIEAKVSVTNLTLKATYSGFNIANAKKCGFELSEKDGSNLVEFTVVEAGPTEMILEIDTALGESLNFKARAWIVVGSKKFYSYYTYFTGLGFPAPEITSVSREYVIKGELFYITGKYFSNDYSNNKVVVKVDNVSANIVSATFNKIEVQMPELKTKGKVKISVNVFGKDAEGMLEIENYWPEIYSVTPEAISPTDEISIKGKFRSSYKDVIYPVQNDFSIYKIVKYTDDEIIIRPGDNMNCDSTYCIYFSLINPYSNEYFNSGYKVKHKGNWHKLNNLPFSYDFNSNYYGLSCQGKGYLIWFNEAQESMLFWKYNPQSDSWTKLPNFPGSCRYTNVFVECNGLIYFGQGSRYTNYIYDDFWKFDPATNIWTKCADLHSENGYSYSGFGVNIQDTIFVFNDNLKAKYDQANNTWQISTCEMPFYDFKGKGFMYEGNYYFQTDWQFYQYNPATNKFTLQYSTYDISYFASAFTAGDKIFMYGSCRIWEVDLMNKRTDFRNELSNYYSKNSFKSENLFDIDRVPYFFTKPNLFCKFSLEK